MNDVLIEDRHTSIVTLTINRPDAMNSLDGKLLEALREAFGRLRLAGCGPHGGR